MIINPKLNIDAYEASFHAIDTHTMGEFTRIIVSGFPELVGETMIERKDFLAEHYDKYRQALMFEPRGHRDMFGALLTDPIHEECDFGIIYMDTGDYLNMCGHGTIGAVTAIIEGGLVPAVEPITEVVLDAPAGIIRTRAEVKNGKVLNVTLTNVPSFLYKENLKTVVDGQEITYDIAFGGSFFALVDIEQMGLTVDPKDIRRLTHIGMTILENIKNEVSVQHPTLDIDSVDLAELYCSSPTPGCDKRNVVIFGDSQADRSPCGTGTSAKLATLYARGEIGMNEPFIYESMIGSTFKGIIARESKETELPGFKGIIPRITGSAFITGDATYIIDGDDPLKYGFQLG